MRLRERLSYANVMATVAVFLALGGGAWALARDRIGSHAIKNSSIRSRDIHQHTIRGGDVRPDSLGGRQVRELSLDASAFTAGTTGGGPGCDPSATSNRVDCAAASLRFPRGARALVIATGGEVSVGGPAGAACLLKSDGKPIADYDATPGEGSTDNTTATATNGFSIARVSPRLRRGRHTFALSCDQLTGDVRIAEPRIAVVMIGSGALVR
jgi:hypothetical protein